MLTTTTTTARPIIQPQTIHKQYGPPPKQSPVQSSSEPQTTTKRPSIFHSSDYDEDLDNISSRFGKFKFLLQKRLYHCSRLWLVILGEEKQEPKYCSWAISSCCNAVSQEKKTRCLQIFGCKKGVEEACTPEKVQQAMEEVKNFLNASRKK